MRIRTMLLVALLAGMGAMSTAQARDDRLNLPVKDLLERADAKDKLGDEVRFYFGDAKHPAVAQTFGEYQSNKKTNAFNKSDKQACEWALLSALVSLRDRALSMGGNAVIGITSNYRNSPFSSATEYQCGAGAVVAGVTMKGTVVKLK